MAATDGFGEKQPASAPADRSAGSTGPHTVISNSSTSMPAMLGRYRIKKRLGGGGMGAVYLVENTQLRRDEALKVPHFESADDPAVRDRFLREAWAAARLDHPNICPIYDAGVIDGVYYLTMRYLQGDLLADISHGPMEPRRAIKIVFDLAKALEHAHRKGVIHRDLKPGNIMICPDNVPTVMDFGLAKQLQEEQKLTRTGTAMGTPAYMPPEQVKGELSRIGPPSDVYSLGVVLFELLTGRLPFEGTAGTIMGKILYENAPLPSHVLPGLSPNLDELCRKAMAKEPEDRFASMQAFADALGGVLESLPASTKLDSANPPITDRKTEQNFKSPTVPDRHDLHDRPTKAPESGWGIPVSLPPTAPLSKPSPPVTDSAAPISARKSSSRVWLALTLMVGGGLVIALLVVFARRARVPKPILNDIGMTMAGIPAGTFQMGSPGDPEEEDGHKDERIHKVWVSEFYLSAYEVTQKQFRAVMGYNPSWFSKNARGKTDIEYLLKPGGGANKIPQGDDTDNYPVENVSWDEAAEFCRKLTEVDTKKPAGWKYRLPTEAEWEYACRGGTSSRVFHVGNILFGRQANFDGNVPYGKADKIDPLNRTCSVASYEKNAFGLYDMHGNVREWCADWYYYHYYRNSPSEDPPGPDEGAYRVVRGGGWDSYGRTCRSAYRSRAEPASRDSDRGFRAALVKAE